MPNNKTLRKTEKQSNVIDEILVQDAVESLESDRQEVVDLFASNVHDVQKIKHDPMKVIGEDGAIERDEAYTELLLKFSDNYNAEKKQIRRQKGWFFYPVLIFLLVMGISGIVLLFLALYNTTLNNTAVVIGATVDIFTSFVAIPSIIARHLFPEKIDEKIVDVVKVLLENDRDIRNAAEQRHNEK